jgi:hypothetical protein
MMEIIWGEKVDDLLEKQEMEVALFPGKFRPPHIGHVEAVKMYSSIPLVIGIVQTKNSMMDIDFIIDCWNKILTELDKTDYYIMVVNQGFIPGMVKLLRSKGLEPKTLICGADRLKSYTKQIDDFNNMVEDDSKIDLFVSIANRGPTGTLIRNALKAGNEELFVANVPECLKKSFENARKSLTNQ